MSIQGFMDWRGNPINKQRHGGVRAALFTYYLEATTSVAFVTILLNLVTYLHDYMHTGVAKSSTITTNFAGAASGFALLGGFLSDSYITRFKTLLIFVPLEFFGYGLLALQAHLPSLRPPGCNTSTQLSNCEQVHGFNIVILYTGLYTVALGEGCLRACLAPFGGDQFDSEDPIESHQQASFFNWFVFSISIGGVIGLTLVVWLNSNKGWDYGLGVCTLAVLSGVLVLASGFPLYRNQKPTGSPLTRILQVFVAAFKNRNLTLPENLEELQQQEMNELEFDSEVLPHTKGLRFLDKASLNCTYSGPWSACTMTQVEETKIILGMFPIFLIAVINYTPALVLITFTTQQGNTMNTKIGKIHISPGSLFIIPTIFQIVIIVVYDRIFVPFARKITGYSNGITQFQRIGIGFVAITSASLIAAFVERKRLKIVKSNGLENVGNGVPMSVLWLGAQFLIIGIADATAFAGLLDFFNSEASRGMKSIGTAIFWCIQGLASLMATILIDIVNKVTRHGSEGRGWLEGATLNQSRLDRFYWLTFGLGVMAFLTYLYCAKMYIYRRNPRIKSLMSSP